MSLETPVYIHLGGHRTGTSSFQMCLHDNRDRIRDQGFDAAYPGRDGIPSGDLGLRLPSPRHGENKQGHFMRKTHKEVYSRISEGSRGIILSEENIPGRMIHFYGGQFYPAAVARMKAISKGLAKVPKRALFVVRPYHELYVSAYRKRAEDNLVDPFGDLRDNFMAMDRGWAEFIALTRDHLAAEELVVVPMSARGDSRNLLKHLVPEMDQTGFVEPTKIVNLSATDAAMDALQDRFRTGEELNRAQWKEIIATHADKRERNGFAEFNAADVKTLTDKYEADLATLSTMDGITFVA